MAIITYDANAASRAAKAREKLMLSGFQQARETAPTTNLAGSEIFELVIDRLISIRAFQLYFTFLRLVDTGTLEVNIPRKNLAEKLGMHRASSVDRYVRELEDLGLLRVEYQFGEYGGHKPNKYTVGLAPCPERVWA